MRDGFAALGTREARWDNGVEAPRTLDDDNYTPIWRNVAEAQSKEVGVIASLGAARTDRP